MNPRILLLAALLAATPALAQDATPPAQPQDPTLDELLGIPGEPKPAPADPSRTDLDRKLAQAEVEDDFVQATELMKEAAARLAEAKDPGLDTQRIQEDTLKLLDKMLDQAQKKQRKQKKQQKQQQQQQQQQDQQQQQQQQSSQQRQQQQQQAEQGDGRGSEATGQDGERNSPLAGDAASWGNLPPHVRDALRQGLGDRFSSMYRNMTEQYYRRLAKDPSNASKPE